MTSPMHRAAARQNTLDEVAEYLAAWGSTAQEAPARARHLLDVVERHGWSLPSTPAPAPRGPGSTATGRVRARLLWVHRRGPDRLIPPDSPVDEPSCLQATCACGAWVGAPFYADMSDRLAGLLAGQHERHVADMLVAGGVTPASGSTRDRHERPAAVIDSPPEGQDTRDGVPNAAQSHTGGRP